MRATALETWNGVPAEALAAAPRPEAGALERERFAATQGRDGEREAVLRFLAGFRDAVIDYSKADMLGTIIHEIREGNHVSAAPRTFGEYLRGAVGDVFDEDHAGAPGKSLDSRAAGDRT